MKRREANWTSVANAASGGIGSYDAIIDPHCRRSVENQSLKHLLAQTRPDAQVSLPRRISPAAQQQARLHGHDIFCSRICCYVMFCCFCFCFVLYLYFQMFLFFLFRIQLRRFLYNFCFFFIVFFA
jgi:hypothetical protein